jgi:membrane protease YdiL (CAAX protease family)
MTPFRQAGLFLFAVFTTTWTIQTLFRPAVDPRTMWQVIGPLIPAVWAPTVIALLMMRVMAGSSGVVQEVQHRLRYSRGTAKWLVPAAVVPMVTYLLAVVSARLAGDTAPFIPFAAVPMMVGVQVITGAVGEELGWRGFLLPRLGQRLGEAWAVWLMAMFWSLWHLPAFFTPGLPHQFMPMFPTLLAIAFIGVFFGFVFNRAGESTLATIVAHLSLNVMLGTGGAQFSSPAFWWSMTVMFGLTAAVTTVWRQSALRQSVAARV